MNQHEIEALCNKCGLAKKTVLSAGKLYPAKWANRTEPRLTLKEATMINRWLRKSGEALEQFEAKDLVKDIERLRKQYGIFKQTLMPLLGTTYADLQRGQAVSVDRIRNLNTRVREIGRALKEAHFSSFSKN